MDEGRAWASTADNFAREADDAAKLHATGFRLDSGVHYTGPCNPLHPCDSMKVGRRQIE